MRAYLSVQSILDRQVLLTIFYYTSTLRVFSYDGGMFSYEAGSGCVLLWWWHVFIWSRTLAFRKQYKPHSQVPPVYKPNLVPCATGIQMQPNCKLLWSPDISQTIVLRMFLLWETLTTITVVRGESIFVTVHIFFVLDISQSRCNMFFQCNKGMLWNTY